MSNLISGIIQSNISCFHLSAKCVTRLDAAVCAGPANRPPGGHQDQAPLASRYCNQTRHRSHQGTATRPDTARIKVLQPDQAQLASRYCTQTIHSSHRGTAPRPGTARSHQGTAPRPGTARNQGTASRPGTAVIRSGTLRTKIEHLSTVLFPDQFLLYFVYNTVHPVIHSA